MPITKPFKITCECGRVIYNDNMVHKYSSSHENRMKKKKEDEEKLKRKEMKLEPKEKNIKKEVNLDDYPINNLFDFSSNNKDKIRASEIIKIVNEKLNIKKNSSQIKKLMVLMGFEHKKYKDGNYYMSIKLKENI